jgi:hypothetical protein
VQMQLHIRVDEEQIAIEKVIRVHQGGLGQSSQI